MVSSRVITFSCRVLAALFLFAPVGEIGAALDGTWAEWSECTKQCGNGTQERLKYCTLPNGRTVECGKTRGACNLKPCFNPFDGVKWSDCDVVCGGGIRSRHNKDWTETQELECNRQSCVPAHGDCKADVIFVLDSSGSLGFLNWYALKQFVLDIVQGLKVRENQTRIGVVSFATMTRVDLILGELFDLPDILQRIWAIEYMAGGTNTADGLFEMHRLFQKHRRSNVKQIAILVTDGFQSLGRSRVIPIAYAAAADDIDIFAVGIDYSVSRSEIGAIATDPKFVYDSASLGVVKRITQQIINITCQEAPVGEIGAALDDNDCHLCNFTKGQIWLPDRNNCHMFFICEPIGYLKYRKQHMTCGDLWWQQDIHTCVRKRPESCEPDYNVVTYLPPSTTTVPCPYEQVPGQERYFRYKEDKSEVQHCVEGMVFLDPPCDCVYLGKGMPSCSDNLVLYFPYEDHYNDVTCHHAIATQYGVGVRRRYDSLRNGNVACFDGHTHFEVAFLRTWFAENNVDKFSVAVWFQREGELCFIAAIVNNWNCKQDAGFSILCKSSGINGRITADSEPVLNLPLMNDHDWHHAALVYDGSTQKLYIDGVLMSEGVMVGSIQNNDVPMHIANQCDESYFVGCLDELRVYDRVLTPAQVDALSKM